VLWLLHPPPPPASAVGDLVGLVEAAARHPPTCQQLREALNMGRNADKWAAFCRGLQDKVSSTPRVASLTIHTRLCRYLQRRGSWSMCSHDPCWSFMGCAHQQGAADCPARPAGRQVAHGDAA
jgi:hypothetical protein